MDHCIFPQFIDIKEDRTNWEFISQLLSDTHAIYTQKYSTALRGELASFCVEGDCNNVVV